MAVFRVERNKGYTVITLDYIMDAIFDPKLKYNPKESGSDAE